MPASVSAQAATKLEIRRTALGGRELGHLGQAEIAVGLVEPGEQRAIAVGRRHRRGIVLEVERRRGAGQMLRNDCLHLRARGGVLLGGEAAQVAARDRGGGHHIGLARCFDAHTVLVDRRGGAAADYPDIEGQILLDQFAAPCVEDAGDLVDRAIAGLGVEDAAAMAGLAGGGKRPAIGAAPRDGAEILAVLAREILEFERDIGPFACLDQVAPRHGNWIAGLLLVACEHHLDVGLSERARLVHRP